MGQITSQLGHLLVQSIPTIVFVIFLLLFLNRQFFKPLSKTLDARASATSGVLAEARQQAERADEKLGEYEKAIHSARQEIYQYREDVRRKALSERESSLQEARRRAETMINTAQADLDKEIAIARTELRASVDSLATEVTVSLFAPRLSRDGKGGAQA